MKTAKQSQYIQSNEDIKKHLVEVDNDLRNLFAVLQGRVRFGGGGDGDRGENISGQYQQFTSDATPDTEFSVSHTLGAIPNGGMIICWQDKAGSLYQGPTTGTNWTSTTVYFKCDVASVTFLIFLMK